MKLQEHLIVQTKILKQQGGSLEMESLNHRLSRNRSWMDLLEVCGGRWFNAI